LYVHTLGDLCDVAATAGDLHPCALCQGADETADAETDVGKLVENLIARVCTDELPHLVEDVTSRVLYRKHSKAAAHNSGVKGCI
jgi:hypothetical protein